MHKCVECSDACWACIAYEAPVTRPFSACWAATRKSADLRELESADELFEFEAQVQIILLDQYDELALYVRQKIFELCRDSGQYP